MLLVYYDVKNKDFLDHFLRLMRFLSNWQDGTIGDDLVVKPISAQVRSHIDTSYPQYKSRPFSPPFLYENQDFVLEKRRTTENDDYEFLDEFESLDDDDVMRNPRRQKRSQQDLVSNFHVVFKRKDSHLSHPSDYGKFKL